MNIGRPMAKPWWLWLFMALILGSTIAFADDLPLIVVLDWYINPDHAPLLVAEQENYFAKQGLKVKLITPADPASGSKLVAAGKADVAISYQPGFMLQVAQGLPLLRFATLIDHPLDCLLVLEDGPIKTIQDFRGKTVGYSNAASGNINLKTMLAYNNVDFNEIKLINVHYNLTQALLTKRIDSFSGAMRNFEPLEIKLAGKEPHAFYPEQNGVPPYDELIFITNAKNTSDQRLVKFVLALNDGRKYLLEHPQSSWEKAIINHPEMNNELNKMAWLKTIKYFAAQPGCLDKEKYMNFAKFLLSNNFINTIPRLSSYAVAIACNIDY